MSLERTQDYRRVKRITDANPMADSPPWTLVISSDFIYLIETDGDKDLGLWVFEPEEDHYLMHSAMTPECRGRNAIESGLNAIGWLFENRDVNAILAPVPKRLH